MLWIQMCVMIKLHISKRGSIDVHVRSVVGGPPRIRGNVQFYLLGELPLFETRVGGDGGCKIENVDFELVTASEADTTDGFIPGYRRDSLVIQLASQITGEVERRVVFFR